MQYVQIRITRTRLGRGCILGRLGIERPFGGTSTPFVCYTLELPWRDNKNNVSCVSPGTYPASIRTDGGWRIELNSASTWPRYLVQIHRGKNSKNTIGCILVGLVNASDNSVGESRQAIRKLQEEIYKNGSQVELTVQIIDTGVIRYYDRCLNEKEFAKYV